MQRIIRFSFALFLYAAPCLPGVLGIASAQNVVLPQTPRSTVVEWTSPKVQHGYGLPETKPNQQGSLTVNHGGITFASKSSVYTIPRAAVRAVSNGDERVELWGMKGRLLRMAIPDGGGIVAAGVMQHKVNMLTIEFRDAMGSYHSAVFYVPAGEGEHVLASFLDIPPVVPAPLVATGAPAELCQPSPADVRSVLVMAPAWDQAAVPAAYRSLVYEHVVDRLQRVKGIGHVYREGEQIVPRNCPQYTIQIAISAFKQGSQVKRSVMGPIGMFVGTTQMAFNASIRDASGRLNVVDQLKVTVRGESESQGIADSFGKKLAKRYASEVKKFELTRVAGPARPLGA